MTAVRIEVGPTFCQLHGKCVERAPEIFRFGDGPVVEHDEEVSGDEAVEAARDAQFLCPVQAIDVIDMP